MRNFVLILSTFAACAAFAGVVACTVNTTTTDSDAGPSSTTSSTTSGTTSSTGTEGTGNQDAGEETDGSTSGGGCKTACAASVCASSPTNPTPGDACDQCIQSDDACATEVQTACDNDANCHGADQCVATAKCDDKSDTQGTGAGVDGGDCSATTTVDDCYSCCDNQFPGGIDFYDNAVVTCECK